MWAGAVAAPQSWRRAGLLVCAELVLGSGVPPFLAYSRAEISGGGVVGEELPDFPMDLGGPAQVRTVDLRCVKPTL